MNKQLSNPDETQPEVSFLITVYKELWAQARHLDEHMERIVILWVLIISAAITAISAIWKFGQQLPGASFFINVGAGLIVLSFIGFVLSLTIPRHRAIRMQYIDSAHKVALYFIKNFGIRDTDKDLSRYIRLPRTGVYLGYFHPLRNDFFRLIMMATIDGALVVGGSILIQSAQVMAKLPELNLVGIPLGLGVGIAFFLIHIVLYYVILLCETQPKEVEVAQRTKQSEGA
jgi:hypothetical protein